MNPKVEEALETLKNMQYNPYEGTFDKALGTTFIRLDPNIEDEKDLYTESLKVEPRGAPRSSLQ